MYKYLKDRSIPFNQCGKLIVASTDADVLELNKVQAQAAKNGVDLRLMDSIDVKIMEPAVKCRKALLSPRTGIFDSHVYMQNLQGDAEASGASFVYNCSVLSGSWSNEDGEIEITLNTSQGVINADIVINAAGLHSIKLVEEFDGYPAHLVPDAFYAKGNYFTLDSSVSSPFSRLIYPVPEIGGLGIHATIDMSGSVRFGPDVEWMKGTEIEANNSEKVRNADREYLHRGVVPNDYSVDLKRSQMFADTIRKYWPDISDAMLLPAYSGIRPKLYGPSGFSKFSSPRSRNLNDFIIEGSASHGVKGLVNLFGIESPGLTSSLSIADYVVNLLQLNHRKE